MLTPTGTMTEVSDPSPTVDPVTGGSMSGRSRADCEQAARRSLFEARRYRGQLEHWRYEAMSMPGVGPSLELEYRAAVRAALGHELWAEHLLGRLSWEQYLVGEKLVPSWHGDSLSDLLVAIRAVAR